MAGGDRHGADPVRSGDPHVDDAVRSRCDPVRRLLRTWFRIDKHRERYPAAGIVRQGGLRQPHGLGDVGQTDDVRRRSARNVGLAGGDRRRTIDLVDSGDRHDCGIGISGNCHDNPAGRARAYFRDLKSMILVLHQGPGISVGSVPFLLGTKPWVVRSGPMSD